MKYSNHINFLTYRNQNQNIYFPIFHGITNPINFKILFKICNFKLLCLASKNLQQKNHVLIICTKFHVLSYFKNLVFPSYKVNLCIWDNKKIIKIFSLFINIWKNLSNFNKKHNRTFDFCFHWNYRWNILTFKELAKLLLFF